MPAASSAAAVPRVASSVKPKIVQFLAERGEVLFVAVIDTEKNRAFTRQALSGSELRFCERQSVRRGNAHDFARRAHLRAENRVDAAEFVEGKYRRFHGVEFVDGNFGNAVVVAPAARFMSASFLPAIKRAATFASGTPVALLTYGTVREARGFTSRT